MRAPGDAIGLLALECAMDELAEALRLDPVELRLRNDTQTDPERNRPFASRHLAEALREGAARFGWDKRLAKPASVRDGRWLVGLGVASAVRGDMLQSATARARLESDGRLTVELAMTDIGTGTYTILSQIAAETMELPVDRVTVRLGDTRFPPTAGSGGSFGAATSGAAVLAACRKLKAGLALRHDGSRGVGHARRARQRATRMPASARISRKSGWIATPARCAFGACSACSRPAASSMRRRRARR